MEKNPSSVQEAKLTESRFVICNNGYTIERYIHGWNDSYNDIQAWKFVDIPSTFGAKKGEYQTHQIKTRDELTQLFGNTEFSSAPSLQVSELSSFILTIADRTQLVELYMPQEDAPVSLKSTAAASAKRNAQISD
jgi:pyruvate decarboxylase